MTPYNLKEQKEPGVKRYSAQPPGFRGNRAFTLVELLIVITIIAMLATMTLLVVGSAQRATRISATETTIARIDAAVCEMYETYSNRRVNTGQLPPNLDPGMVAKIRLHLLLDTMRMEMPQNWDEVSTGPRPFEHPVGTVWTYTDSGGVVRGVLAEVPALRQVYLRELASADKSDPYLFNAKLLYQIVMNGNPEAREMFTERGVAIDDDGLPYFADAWGRPICFLRWAPGFAGSDRQPNLWKWTGNSPDKGTGDANAVFWGQNLSPNALDVYQAPTSMITGVIQHVRQRYSDPLDVVGVRQWSVSNGQPSAYPGWFLVPLVFSAGPDGVHDIEIPANVIVDPFQQGYGAPAGLNGYDDNIHNHRLGGR